MGLTAEYPLAAIQFLDGFRRHQTLVFGFKPNQFFRLGRLELLQVGAPFGEIAGQLFERLPACGGERVWPVGFIAKLLHRIYERLIKRQWQFSKIGSPAGSGFKEGSDGGPMLAMSPRHALASVV